MRYVYRSWPVLKKGYPNLGQLIPKVALTLKKAPNLGRWNRHNWDSWYFSWPFFKKKGFSNVGWMAFFSKYYIIGLEKKIIEIEYLEIYLRSTQYILT